MSTLQVLVPYGQRLYDEALRTALEADPAIDEVATTVVVAETDIRGSHGGRPDLFLLAATTADGEVVRLAHRLWVTTGVPVDIFDAPDDPAFILAAYAAGVRTVLPHTTSWLGLRACIRRQLGHDSPPPAGGMAEDERTPTRRSLLGALQALSSEDRAVLAMSLRGVPRSMICVRTGETPSEVEHAVARGHRALGADSAVAALEVVLRNGLFETVSLAEVV